MLQVVRSRPFENDALVDAARYWLDSRPLSGRATCGDFAGCFPLDASRLAIVIGDVAGRGPAAGAAAAAVFEHARRALPSRRPLGEALRRLDTFFTRTVMSEAVPLASAFVGLVDVKNGVLTYASAGHEPALLFATPTRHDHLHPTGPILGLGGLKRCGFTERTFRWSDRSVLVAVTDGITEARRYESGRPKFFGSFAVARAFINAHRAQVDPARAIGEAAREHANGHARDDATVLVVRSDRRESARSLPR